MYWSKKIGLKDKGTVLNSFNKGNNYNPMNHCKIKIRNRKLFKDVDFWCHFACFNSLIGRDVFAESWVM